MTIATDNVLPAQPGFFLIWCDTDEPSVFDDGLPSMHWPPEPIIAWGYNALTGITEPIGMCSAATGLGWNEAILTPDGSVWQAVWENKSRMIIPHKDIDTWRAAMAAQEAEKQT